MHMTTNVLLALMLAVNILQFMLTSDNNNMLTWIKIHAESISKYTFKTYLNSVTHER